MRKIFLVFTFLILAYCNIFAQTKEFKFTPKWKVGDKKTASFSLHETQIKHNVLEIDTTKYYDVEFIVQKENKDNYILQVLYDNIAIRNASMFYDKIGNDLKNYKKIELIYQIDKLTGKAEITNSKEVQKFMTKSFEQINIVLKKKNPDMASFSQLSSIILVEYFKNKKNIEEYMDKEIGFLFIPFGKKFEIGDTLSIKQSCANPFNKMDTINQIKLMSINSIDESTRTCKINTSEVYELDKFIKMMKGMLGGMVKSLGSEEDTLDEKAKEIADFDFNIDFSNYTVIDFDYNSTWPLKVVTNSNVKVFEPSKKNENTFVKTVTIK